MSSVRILAAVDPTNELVSANYPFEFGGDEVICENTPMAHQTPAQNVMRLLEQCQISIPTMLFMQTQSWVIHPSDGKPWHLMRRVVPNVPKSHKSAGGQRIESAQTTSNMANMALDQYSSERA